MSVWKAGVGRTAGQRSGRSPRPPQAHELGYAYRGMRNSPIRMRAPGGQGALRPGQSQGHRRLVFVAKGTKADRGELT